MSLNEKKQLGLGSQGALPGGVWSLGFKRTVGSWGARGLADSLPDWEQCEQRSGCYE